MFLVFTTCKGSVYMIYNYGKTKRYKVATEELYVESLKTFYVSPIVANIIAIVIKYEGYFTYEDEKLYIQFNQNQFEVIYENKPKIGLHPFEIWGSLKHPEYVHIGNEIDNIL